MKISTLLIDIAATAAIVLAVSVVITYSYTYAAHGSGAVDWETSFRLALTLGIALPLVHRRQEGSGLPRRIM